MKKIAQQKNKSVPEFYYRLSWRSGAYYPGNHKAKKTGSGQELHSFAELMQHPDARRLDLRRTLRDPFGQYYVRLYRQKSLVPVYVVADLSASMNYKGVGNKRELLLDFCQSLAFSAAQKGDRFGFIGCQSNADLKLYLSDRRGKGHFDQFLSKLKALSFDKGGAGALMKAAHLLTGQRKMVFLLSDFHMPLKDIKTILMSLAQHEVIPIVLWDSGEHLALPNWGIVRFRDLETGQEQQLFMRPRFKQKIKQHYQKRQADLSHLFLEHGCVPFYLADTFEAEALTKYFLER